MSARVSRRGLMAGMAGSVIAAGAAGAATAQSDEPDYGDWFSDVSNFDGTVDARGEGTVSVVVGAEANGGNFGFGPAAVMVSPGTTVVWEWTGSGGIHNVVAEDGTFDSGDPVQDAGTTFEYTFEEPGIYEYVCEPHESIGMKGAIVVGAPPDGPGDGGDGGGTPTNPGIGLAGGAVLAAFTLPLAYALYANSDFADSRLAVEAPSETPEAPEVEPDVEIGHDEFDPWGTAWLVVAYFLIVLGLWVFMYFVEFLGRVTVVG